MNKPFRALRFLLAAVSVGICTSHGPSQAAGPPNSCSIGSVQAAAENAASRPTMPVNMFGRPETGWALYEPLIANEIGTNCAANTPGFAKALTHWQAVHHLAATGKIDPGALGTLKQVWQARRPFVIASRKTCPDPPPEQALAMADAGESYGGKTIQLRADALAAYRRMIQAARKAHLIPGGSNLGTIFSGYRSPDYDAARCALQHNCQGVVRARCSAHRTGYAMDINVGAAPGFSPDSSDDANRLYISRTPFYRWLVKNAAKFHLMNYPFEPWHWEYAGGATR